MRAWCGPGAGSLSGHPWAVSRFDRWRFGVNMFEGPVTGNIPEVLDNGEVTDGTHVTAGQLALALTPYAQVTDLAVNTAASGNNAAAIQLDDRVTAELASKLDSSALAPAIAPLATAAALATTDGVATKSTPDGVGLKLSNYSTTAAKDGGGPALPRHSGEGAVTPSSRAKTLPSRGCRPPRQTPAP